MRNNKPILEIKDGGILRSAIGIYINVMRSE